MTTSALTSYNSLRSGRTRLARRVLAFGLRTGLAQPLLRNKIDVGVAPSLAPAQAEVRSVSTCVGCSAMTGS